MVLETLKKKAEEFAIADASEKVMKKVMDAVGKYVQGEMKKVEGEFGRMGTYINKVESKVDALEKRVKELEKAKIKEGEL